MLKITKFGDYVEVMDQQPDALQTERKVGVNWSALGTVPVEKTEQFIKDLQAAVEFARSL